MRIIAKRTIVEYYDKNPNAKNALENWYKIVSKVVWNNFADIKNTFNSVDNVGNNLYVFNIRGNDYRLIVRILFEPKIIYVRFIGTHKEYDSITDISNL